MYAVEWAPEALDELAGLWVEASPDVRRVITAAAEQLDHDLQSILFSRANRGVKTTRGESNSVIHWPYGSK